MKHNGVKAFNKTAVHLLNMLQEELIKKYIFLLKNIYNYDETGISAVQYPAKVLTATGEKKEDL